MTAPHTKIPLRVVIYPKDVENITGLGDRASRKLIQKIKTGLGKSKPCSSPFRNFLCVRVSPKN
jgi:hypothetical protein